MRISPLFARFKQNWTGTARGFKLLPVEIWFNCGFWYLLNPFLTPQLPTTTLHPNSFMLHASFLMLSPILKPPCSRQPPSPSLPPSLHVSLLQATASVIPSVPIPPSGLYPLDFCG